MSGKPRSRGVLWVGVALLALLLIGDGMVCLTGAMIASWPGTGTDSSGVRDTQAAFRVRVADGKVEFDLLYGHAVTGIVRFTVTDGTPLWTLSGLYATVPLTSIPPAFMTVSQVPSRGLSGSYSGPGMGNSWATAGRAITAAATTAIVLMRRGDHPPFAG